MSGYNTQITGNPNVAQGEYKYNLQFFTNDADAYKLVEKACQDVIEQDTKS